MEPCRNSNSLLLTIKEKLQIPGKKQNKTGSIEKNQMCHDDPRRREWQLTPWVA